MLKKLYKSAAQEMCTSGTLSCATFSFHEFLALIRMHTNLVHEFGLTSINSLMQESLQTYFVQVKSSQVAFNKNK